MRIPGILTDDKVAAQLKLDLLNQIMGRSPVQGTFFVVLLLVQRRAALSNGPFPLILPKSPRGPSESGSPALTQLDTAADISDKQLLELALQRTQEKFRVVHQWLLLHLERDPAFAGLQTGKGMF